MSASAPAPAPPGVRVRAQYGPSLARLLAPWWGATSRLVRGTLVASAGLLVGLLLAVGLTLENSSFSHGGVVPFSFEYRDLYRVAPEVGAYVKVQSRYANGELKYSYAVDGVTLPVYDGEVQGVLPVYATGFIRGLAHRYRGFTLRGEGKTKVNNTLIGYQVAFTAEVEGEEMYGRYVLFTPPQRHPRAGVAVEMLASPEANASVLSPLEVAESGVLLRPLKTFAFG
ncbi:MAG TPA: hypothetical protein VK765_03940 [Solirubrobacteraceae bacterium]|nr:hypothetical protein [Solirubrobacteraceae bacterium]